MRPGAFGFIFALPPFYLLSCFPGYLERLSLDGYTLGWVTPGFSDMKTDWLCRNPTVQTTATDMGSDAFFSPALSEDSSTEPTTEATNNFGLLHKKGWCCMWEALIIFRSQAFFRLTQFNTDVVLAAEIHKNRSVCSASEYRLYLKRLFLLQYLLIFFRYYC